MVLNAGEANTVAEYELAVNTTTAKNNMVVHTRKTNLHKYFKRSKAPKYSDKTKTAAAVAPQKAGEEHCGDKPVG